MISSSRSFRRALIVTAAVMLGVVIAPGSALAHARLVSSNPKAGSTVASPRVIKLTFSESPMLMMSRLHLIGSAGDTILIEPRVDPTDAHSIVADVARTLAPGKYELAWSTAARDGHPSQGSFSFSVEGAAPTTALTTPSEATPPVTDSVSLPVSAPNPVGRMTRTGEGAIPIIARWLGYISIFLVVGAVTFRFRLLGEAERSADEAFTDIASTNAATLGVVAAVGSLVTTVMRVVRESIDMPDVPVTSMLGSSWGWSIIATLIASLIAIVAFSRAHSSSSPQRDTSWRIALIAAAVLVVTPAFSGHAIGSDSAWIGVPIDIIHVAAGSTWLGTLAAIAVVGIPAALKTPGSVRPGARVAQLINAFSPTALKSGAAIVATGLIQSFMNLPRLDALWTTQYGSALYRKLIFVILLFAIGAWNWRRLKPRLGGDDGVVILRKTAAVEMLFAVLVLAITAILVVQEIPG